MVVVGVVVVVVVVAEGENRWVVDGADIRSRRTRNSGYKTKR